MQNAPSKKRLNEHRKKKATENPKCSGVNSKSTRGGKSGGNDETKTKRESRGGRGGIKGVSRGGAKSSRENK